MCRSSAFASLRSGNFVWAAARSRDHSTPNAESANEMAEKRNPFFTAFSTGALSAERAGAAVESVWDCAEKTMSAVAIAANGRTDAKRRRFISGGPPRLGGRSKATRPSGG